MTVAMSVLKNENSGLFQYCLATILHYTIIVNTKGWNLSEFYDMNQFHCVFKLRSGIIFTA